MRFQILSIALAMLALAAPASASPETTFTYQGSLNQSGSPADGAYDLGFSLWDAPAGGTQIGATVQSPSHAVADGLFTVQLDFGAAALDGNQRWLQISVNAVTLAPRTPVTPSPYAVQTRGIYVDELERTGLGTIAPESRLHIFTGSAGAVTTWPGSLATLEASSHAYLSLLAPPAFERGIFFGEPASNVHGGILYNSAATPNGFQFRTGGNTTRMVIASDGDVGIGTDNPIANLQVRGAGTSGVLRVTNGGSGGGTAIIAADVGSDGRAASFFGTSSSTLFSCTNVGTGLAASFSGGVTMTSGNLGVGTTNPKGTLHVTGDYYGLGHVWLHAFEGDGADGTAYVQARDDSGTSTIDMVFRTQFAGDYIDTMRLDGSRVAIGGEDPSLFLAKLYVAQPATSIIANPPALTLDRTALDGVLVAFRALGSQRGSISVSGNTVSYNAFTGSHYAYPDTDAPIARATLVRMTGNNRADADDPTGEIVYGIAPTTTPNDPACLGSYLAPMSLAEGPDAQPDLVMAAGNGDLWVVDAGTGDLEPGDGLISSDVPGCAMKDDPARFATGHVVARCAQRIAWHDIAPGADGHRRARISVLFGAYERGPTAAALAEENKRLRDRLDALEALVRDRVEQGAGE